MIAADRRRLVLDTPSLVYRAFFGLPVGLEDSAGQPINAVRGYIDMVSFLIREERPTDVIHVFDADWRPAWRVAAYPAYKAERRGEPEELTGQFDIIRKILDAAGTPAVEVPGEEADDVIGTLADRATRATPIAIVTGDRDLLQLVRDPEVVVISPVKGVRETRRFDEAAVLAHHGVRAEQYADYAILRGDPSDGLPGVSGIGTKTAARLLSDHGSLDAIIAARAHLPPRVSAAIIEQADYLTAMQTVVPLRRTLGVTIAPHRAPDSGELKRLGALHNSESPVGRLMSALALLG